MNAKEVTGLKCLDPEKIIPISRQSTEAFKTGTWSKVRPLFMEKTAPCRAACPIGNDIPRAVYQASQGDYDRALAIFLQETPLPGVCGRVCYHPCQVPCNRVEVDGAVQVRALERTAAELGSAEPLPLTEAGRGKPVAVVGAGPAGLAAAYHLGRMGHSVSLIEAADRPGGLLAQGIPPFRLPARELKRDLDRILSLPIQLQLNKPVDETLLSRLMADHQAVFLAMGADSHKALGIQGEDLEGVVHGIPFLRQAELQVMARGADVAVIGGGNTAMDTARTALRSGAKTVTVLYRRGRSEMPAFDDEVAEAEEEGITFRFLSGPVGFVGRDGRVKALRLIKNRLGTSGSDGRLRPEAIPGSEWELPCDLVIIGAGQVPGQSAMLRDLQWEGGRVWIDESGRTSRNGLFAGGDLTPVRAAVVDAIASGKRAAVSIHMALTGKQDRENILGITLGQGPGFSIEALFNSPPRWKPEEVVGLDELDRLTANRKPPADLPHRSGTERTASFDEVALSLNAEQAGQEAGRCFFCGTCVGCDRCYVFCPEGAIIPPEVEGGAYQANDVFCKGCGTCSSGCIRGVLETDH